MTLVRLVCAALLLAGCVTLPQGAGSGAGYAGDQASLGLEEVIASLPAKGTPPYRNLHVGLAVIINPAAGVTPASTR